MTYIDRSGIMRFVRYVAVGTSTFGLDLALLAFFVQVVHLQYLFATGISFLIAVSLNYVLSRKWVFSRTSRTYERGYVNFLLIAVFGLFLVVSLMAVAVEYFFFSYIIALVLVACVVGMLNYLLNLYWNFNIAGKH